MVSSGPSSHLLAGIGPCRQRAVRKSLSGHVLLPKEGTSFYVTAQIILDLSEHSQTYQVILRFIRSFSDSSGHESKDWPRSFYKKTPLQHINIASYSSGPSPVFFFPVLQTRSSTIIGLSAYPNMACNSPDYIPSEMSAQNSPLPSPGPTTRFQRPAIPRNAVVYREHPPLYAGDFNNNLSKDMYWWEKLDINDAEEKRVLLAMYYGEERKPRCSVCEKQNRACMWFLGEEEQTHKSCVKCRRVHATCKPSRIRNKTDGDDSRRSIELRAEPDQQSTSSQKRKAAEPDVSDTNGAVKRTRSSWRAYPTRESTDDQPEVIFVRSQDNQYARKLESTPQTHFETPLRSGPSGLGSHPTLDDETEVDTFADQSNTAERRDGRISSITLGADAYGQESHVHGPRRRSQGNPSVGLSKIAQGIYAVMNECYKTELEDLRTTIKRQAADHQAQILALTKKGQSGQVVDENQIEKLETQIETERSNRRWLEDEITRLKARVSRLESGP